MELALVQAGLKDLEQIMAWRMRVLAEVFAPLDPAQIPALEKANRLYYQQHLANDSHLCFFLEDQAEKQVKGCGGICLWQEMPSPDNPSGQCAYFMNIFIDPKYRHQHLARWMVLHMVEICKTRQITKIYLESTKEAKSLYEACGFVPLEDYMILKS